MPFRQAQSRNRSINILSDSQAAVKLLTIKSTQNWFGTAINPLLQLATDVGARSVGIVNERANQLEKLGPNLTHLSRSCQESYQGTKNNGNP
jgi:hypothetical protein